MKKHTRILFCVTIVFGLAFFVLSSLKADFPNKDMTRYIIIGGKPMLIQDGMKLTVGGNYGAIRINLEGNHLSNAVFDHCGLENSDLEETTFVNCSFNGANLSGCSMYDSNFIDCDFTDAVISGVKYLRITSEQLQSTWSFKHKTLLNTNFSFCDFSGVDFSGFNLNGTTFRNTKLGNCNFSNAHIQNSVFDTEITKEQLSSTADFRNKELIMMEFSQSDFSGMDFSGFNLTGTKFRGVPKSVNLANANFDGAIISRCDFSLAQNLTLAQIKSTWNYKHGRMEGITLPEKLQQELDAEKVAEAK